jgi:CMP-N,N'-diacetyllegionaminic acid synthase
VINGKSAIGIVPARGGSKGLPGKNIRPLCGKPLIGWTIEKALRSRHLDVVVVSTDSEEIAAVARSAGADVPFLRPAALATDKSSSMDVVRHVLDHYRAGGREFVYTALLEPTSPLREDGDIDAMLEQLDAQAQFDAIVSVGEVGEHPSIMKRLTANGIEPFARELALTTRRQDNEPAYFPYGVAYISRTANMLAENTFYPQACTAFPLQRYQNYEIDDIYDFLCVEAVMKHQWRLA